MANQVAGSQTKLAADVAQLQTDVGSLNSKLANRFETIWTNPSPSQSFGGQTLTVNMTGVRMVVIYFRYNTSATLGTSHLVPYSYERDLAIMSNSAGSFAIVTREVVVRPDSNNIIFGDCYAHTSTSGSATDNTKMIPYKILAIK